MNQNEIRALGATLRRIDRKLLKTAKSNQSERIWYQGEEPYFDVFFDLLDNEVIWFQFTLRGQCLTWHQHQPGLETGFTFENHTTPSKHPASKIIHADNNVDCNFLDIVQAIMQTRAREFPFDRALAILKNSP
ncbi:MAG: hypothetical protein AB4352_01140 [Hormoscilla sp.]